MNIVQRAKYFCSTRLRDRTWLDTSYGKVSRHGRPIEFIRHRRESGGYQKVTNDSRLVVIVRELIIQGTEIQRVDNRTELD